MKTITIGERDLNFESTALTAIAYKRIFGSDVLASLNKNRNLANDINLNDALKQLAFVMNKQAEGMSVENLMKLQELDYWKWINEFHYGDFTSEVITELICIWTESTITTSEAKNAEGAQLDK